MSPVPVPGTPANPSNGSSPDPCPRNPVPASSTRRSSSCACRTFAADSIQSIVAEMYFGEDRAHLRRVHRLAALEKPRCSRHQMQRLVRRRRAGPGGRGTPAAAPPAPPTPRPGRAAGLRRSPVTPASRPSWRAGPGTTAPGRGGRRRRSHNRRWTGRRIQGGRPVLARLLGVPLQRAVLALTRHPDYARSLISVQPPSSAVNATRILCLRHRTP